MNAAFRASKDSSAEGSKKRKRKRGQAGPDDEGEETAESKAEASAASKERHKKEDAESKKALARDRREKLTEFLPASQRRDLASATFLPPKLPALKKAAMLAANADQQSSAPVGSSRLPLSAAQQAAVAEERERAINMYREMKETREKRREAKEFRDYKLAEEHPELADARKAKKSKRTF